MDEEEEEFDYIIKHPPPPRLCFGSTRLRMPQPSTILRADSELLSKAGSCRQLQMRCPGVLSKLGYGPLTSKTPRFANPNAKTKMMPKRSGSSESKNPAKTTATLLSPLCFSFVEVPPPSPPHQCWPPFGRSMRERLIVSTTPGPCRYMPYHTRIERVAHSFGGRRRIRPAVYTVCAPNCQVVCALCRRRQPQALFWMLRGQRMRDRVLCRRCMAATRQRLRDERSTVRRHRVENELNRFGRSRYCAYMHLHFNTTAKQPVQGRLELQQLYRIENYLATFGI